MGNKKNNVACVVTGNAAVSLPVRYQGRRYMLKCYTRPSDRLPAIYGEAFHSKELCVVDFAGRYHWVDCLLAEYVEGRSLDEVLCEATTEEEFSSLAREFDRMAGEILRSERAHGDLKPENIIVCEDGSMFVEEYTLVAVADYILSKQVGNTVSNLSSSRALRDITNMHGGNYSASAVGEVNVVEMMKKTGAIIGGEGNGGGIYPELHYGRDALVGTALFLTYFAGKNMTMTALKSGYPQYVASKNKIELTPAIDVDKVLLEMKSRYASENVNDIDGVKIDFAESWVHLRKSNTEPIIRIYTEAKSAAEADALAERFIAEISEICNL